MIFCGHHQYCPLHSRVFLHRRKTAPNAICDEERTAIKAVLLGCLGEPGKEVALQIAVVIGKIARFDVPREWPELLPALMASIQNASGNDLVQHRDEISSTQGIILYT